MTKIFSIVVCITFLCAGSVLAVDEYYLDKGEVPPEMLKEIAELHTNVLNTFIPEYLKGIASRLAHLRHRTTVSALEDILKKCDEIEKQNPRSEVIENLDIARAYAIFGLLKFSRYYPECNRIISEHFRMSRPVGIAMIKSRYPDMFKLLGSEINRLFDAYPSLQENLAMANDIKRRYPGVEFVMQSRFPDDPYAVDPELLNTMLEIAVTLEDSRSPNGAQVCKRMLSHEGSFFWEKLVYRAYANLAIHPAQRYDFLRRRLSFSRNKESDQCVWNLSKPDSILFSIKNISTEAFLILTMWRMPVPLSQKVTDTVKSLTSTSFTARAAAIDCLATTPESSRSLKSVLYYNDTDTRHFMAVRLSTETNDIAKILLNRLADDKDPAVAADALRAIGRE